MTRLIACLVTCLGLTGPLAAECTGTSLMDSLTPDQRAEVTARLDATPYPVGNHWRATRGDEVIHLIGTMHLSDPRLDDPAWRMQKVIEQAGLLLVEMAAPDKADFEAAMQSRLDMVVLSGTTLPELLGEEDWTALSAAMQARGLPPFMGAKMQPWLISMMMAIPPCMDPATATDDGMDTRLEAYADAAGVPVRSLEPWETAFRVFADTPLDTQVSMIRSTLVGDGVAEDLFETMLTAYFTESHAEIMIAVDILGPVLSPLDEEENASVTRVMEDHLLDARNRAWIPVILDAADQTEAPVVAAFGAAHLGGEAGVLRLLEAEGFALERQPF